MVPTNGRQRHQSFVSSGSIKKLLGVVFRQLARHFRLLAVLVRLVARARRAGHRLSGWSRRGLLLGRPLLWLSGWCRRGLLLGRPLLRLSRIRRALLVLLALVVVALLALLIPVFSLNLRNRLCNGSQSIFTIGSREAPAFRHGEASERFLS